MPGALPLYGTCTSLVFVNCWKYSPARWDELPMPNEA